MKKYYTKEKFANAVKISNSIKELIINLGMNYRQKNVYGRIKKFSSKFNISIEHLYKKNNLVVKRNETYLKRQEILDEQIIKAIREADTFYGAIRILGLRRDGSSKKWLMNKTSKLNLDTSHFNYFPHGQPRRALEEILIKDSTYHGGTHYLKLRLLKNNLLKNKCYECTATEWFGKQLSLQLDHINGNNTDNRIENLRLLCPNCHSLTETYCGKNKGKIKY